ncbi:Holliday junction resolvase RuvX [Motiliproteus coralliicola]|uniref:Putative pre-16S rRNA nuclease n=1 Tax=Motiliproteus coralliicola TaxID=2283196 RepID=A0A369WC60_9GAMM|nr:Holliday junction resolvase RuvX [Motiliproteus coralliicola]RDE18911.1 Holliday junction resolvase RuvX [Motiliproteus coralliicola]
MILAFDFGTTRFGVAVGQAITATATPLKPIAAKDGVPDWGQIEALFKEWQPEAFVVGLPLNMDGTLCEMSYRARKFANRLHARFDRPSYLTDERLSSHEAKGIHLDGGGEADFKKHSMDGLAAQLILESWFREPEHRSSLDKLTQPQGTP